jgi:hypothetical protein
MPPTSCRLASRRNMPYNKRYGTWPRTLRRLHLRRSTRRLLHLHHRRHRRTFCRLPTGCGRYRTSSCSTTTRSRLGLLVSIFYIFFLSLCKLFLNNGTIFFASIGGISRCKRTRGQFRSFQPTQMDSRE